MINDKTNCSGCRACENICPKNSISILERHDRFLCIRDKDCINCGLCEQVCPHINIQKNLRNPIMGKNAFAKQKSKYRSATSGGIASVIYQYCQKNDIDCIGVNYTDDFELIYTRICNPKRYKKAIGSKYVYSNMNNIYSQVADRLQSQRTVVFIGLPCHTAALLNYLNNKKINLLNFYCVDIACHGVIMPDIFQNHIRYLEKKYKVNLKECQDIQFRNRNNQYGITLILNNAKYAYFSKYDGSYMQLFLRGFLTKACLECPYAQRNRVGDLSIKDCSTPFINMEIKSPKQSSVLINTSKGLELWDRVKEYLYEYDYPIGKIVSEDSILVHPTRRPRGYNFYNIISYLLGDKIAYLLVFGTSSFYGKYFKR